MMAANLRIGFIGDGGISRAVRDLLAERSGVSVVGVVGRRAGEGVTTDLAEMLARRPTVVVECAGHAAVRQYGAAILATGASLVIVSIGALADEELLCSLESAAAAGGARLILASGAMAAIDALAAARIGGLTRVRYTGRKPPRAWAGSPAEAVLDLDTVAVPATFYRGTAREAAAAYPKNANVAATIALAGLGFDSTEVELVADPTIDQNVHELVFEGADGRFEIRIAGRPSPANPKTSALTAHSIVRLIDGMSSSVVI